VIHTETQGSSLPSWNPWKGPNTRNVF